MAFSVFVYGTLESVPMLRVWHHKNYRCIEKLVQKYVLVNFRFFADLLENLNSPHG